MQVHGQQHTQHPITYAQLCGSNNGLHSWTESTQKTPRSNGKLIFVAILFKRREFGKWRFANPAKTPNLNIPSSTYAMYTGSLKSRAVRHKMNRNGNRHYCRSPTLLGVTVCLAFLLWWHWDKPALGTSLSWRFRKENSSENDLAFPVPGTKPIPSKIWQIHLPKHTEERASIDPGSIADTTSWLASNPGFQ